MAFLRMEDAGGGLASPEPIPGSEPLFVTEFPLRSLLELFFTSGYSLEGHHPHFTFTCAELGGWSCFGYLPGSAASLGTSTALLQLPAHDFQNCIFYLELELHLECLLTMGKSDRRALAQVQLLS